MMQEVLVLDEYALRTQLTSNRVTLSELEETEEATIVNSHWRALIFLTGCPHRGFTKVTKKGRAYLTASGVRPYEQIRAKHPAETLLTAK